MSYQFAADDKSYREAKALIESGELGHIHAVETWMSDVQDPAGKTRSSSVPLSNLLLTAVFVHLGHFVAFAAQSGGIFLDMGIHHVSHPSLGHPSLV